MMRLACAALGGASILALAAPAQADDTAVLKAQVAALQARLDQDETRLTRQEDIEKVRVVAFSYGDYMDNAMYDQVLSLFSPDIESCEIAGYGVFKGHAGCDRLWNIGMGATYGGATNSLAFGHLAKHYLVKDVISIAPDGLHAHGRFDYIGYGATLGKPESVHNQLGVYNFDFTKEDGIWKISKFRLVFDTINFNYRDWTSNPGLRCLRPATKPDAPSMHHPFPETAVTAFHDPNPVTGLPIPEHVTDTHYWQGNWPGEWGGECGRRPDAPTAAK